MGGWCNNFVTLSTQTYYLIRCLLNYSEHDVVGGGLFAGPCYNDSCPNPGQVCIVEGGNAVCVCPDCTGRPEEPVCSLVGNVVKTFENECKMKQYACELTKNFAVLENRTCEGKR